MNSTSQPGTEQDGLLIPRHLLILFYFFIALAIVWAILSIQYVRYGMGQPLGWDTVVTAAWAARIIEEGALTIIAEMNYVNLYFQIVAGVGWALGSPLLAQMVIPAILTATLVVALGVLSREIFGSDRLALATVLIAAPFIGTLRLLNDLHRAMLAYLLALILLLLISRISWVTSRRRNLMILLGLAVALSLTEVEVYVLFLTTVVLGALLIRWRTGARVRRELLTVLILSVVPGLAIVLIFPGLVIGYLPSFVILDFNTILRPDDALAFTGYLALPVVLIGAYELLRRYRTQEKAIALYLLLWALILTAIFLAAAVGLIRLNPLRPLFLLPIPVLAIGGAVAVYRFVKTSELPGRWPKRSQHRVLLRASAVALAGIILLGILIPTTAFVERSLRPQLRDAELSKIRMTAQILEEAGILNPIVIFYGPNYLWKSDVVQAHLYLEVGDFLPYYGKLVYLLTEPDFVPGLGTRFGDGPLSQLEALEYGRTTLSTAAQIGDVSEPLGRSLVILSPDFYSFPLSEPFLAKFVSHDGVWILPAGSITQQDLNNWRWFAYSDYADVSRLRVTGIPWGVTHKGLLLEARGTPAFADYRFDVYDGGTYQLRIHYEFLGTSASDEAWIEIDGQVVGSLTHTTSPDWILQEFALDSRIHHTVRVVLSEDADADLILDVIELVPSQIS